MVVAWEIILGACVVIGVFVFWCDFTDFTGLSIPTGPV